MFSEKNISKFIILTPIITAILIAFFTIYFFIQNQNAYFEEESIRVEKEYISKQKNILEKEINSVINYINYHEKSAKLRIKNSVKEKLEYFVNQTEVLYKDKKITNKNKLLFLKDLIDSKSINDSYYFAYDVKKNSFIQPSSESIQKEFELNDKFIKNYLYPDTGKFLSLKDKIIYIKYNAKLDWIIGYVEDTKASMKNMKNGLKRYIETIRYENNGYIWIHDINYYLVAHPFRQDSLGSYDIALKDAVGTLITKQFIDETIKKPDGVFIEYFWQKPSEKHFSKKLGFFRLYGEFGWVIGAGLYMDDIQKSILENKKSLENRINKYIRLVVFVSFFVILIIGVLSFIVSNKVSRVFNIYKKNVKRKEAQLEDMNKNLEKKVLKAVEDVKKKDRAMLHQSRLARMGIMLSMIAHQWRQPLSKVSALLMELETATRFKKSDEKMIFETINESNKLLYYMSNTIDDFRNFFKPDKKKVEFFVDDACYKALNLVEATLHSLGVKIIKDIKTRPKVLGYEREFSQVILNLLSNARYELSENEIKEPKISLKIYEENKNVVIEVLDNAGGVKEENLELIFEPYFTTKGSLKGTGLGLYISKMIIEKNMNGELSVLNIDGGAQFKIVLKGVIDG